MDRRTSSRVLVLKPYAQSLATRDIDQSTVPQGWIKIATDSYTPGVSLPGNTTRVPKYLNSAEALIFCSYDKEIAQRIYSAYCSWQVCFSPRDREYGQQIIKFARGYIHMKSLVDRGLISQDKAPLILRTDRARRSGRFCELTTPTWQRETDRFFRGDEEAERANTLWRFLLKLDDKVRKVAADAEEQRKRGGKNSKL